MLEHIDRSVPNRSGLYCEAQFSRGAGLGTRLFTWARCLVFSHVHGVPMLAPQWVQARIGPLLRGGISLRAYARQILLFGLFQPRAGEIVGLTKFSLQMSSQRIAVPDKLDSLVNLPNNNDVIITFSGTGGMFNELNSWENFIREQLVIMTRPRWHHVVEKYGIPEIAINVRLGNDFHIAQSPNDYWQKGGIKTPLDWFIDSLQTIRDAAGYDARAVVVSDGTSRQLAPLLSLPNVTFIRPGCAISDLLTLANSKIMLASGASSFSAWAAFLGQMPVISHPGQPLTWFGMLPQQNQFVGEYNPDIPNMQFLQCAVEALKSRGNY